MKPTEEAEFVRQLLESDQPVQVDAQRLTRELVAIRRNRKKVRRIQRSVVAIASVACIASLCFLLPQFLRPEADTVVANSPPSPVGKASPALANRVELGPATFGLTTSWKYQEHEDYQRKLALLKSEISEMQKKNSAQQMTMLKEHISRSLFDEIGADTILTNY